MNASRIIMRTAAIIGTLMALLENAPAEGLKNVVPKNQKPIRNVFQPSSAEQARPGVGKFVIFARVPIDKNWDFIATAWECIPSRPETPVTKRVEFCHSSWNCDLLLDTLAADGSDGMYPQFARLQVDNGDQGYTVNLYDINYWTWDVRCIWQGNSLYAFGVMDGSIFCNSADGWLLLRADSGKISQEIPFVPLETDNGFWLVRKPGESEGCWSYDPKKQQYIAHFGRVDSPQGGFSWSMLSPDGKNRAWVLASPPDGWRGGVLAGQLILQRGGKKEDISVPIEIRALAGSGVAVIPKGVQMMFSPEGKLRLHAQRGDPESEDRVWTIDIAAGTFTSGVEPHSKPAEDTKNEVDGVSVPDYLRPYLRGLEHFGRNGLAPAFLIFSGMLKEPPEYPDCTAGVSPDGRHVLYQAKKGPLAGVFIYGDLQTKQIVRWTYPDGLDSRDEQAFVWVETPN